MSLSARRAWIEISTRSQPARPKRVALRKESVDRNQAADISVKREARSLSARRAWIEIKSSIEEVSKYVVALRKESVDRNANFDGFRWWVEVALRKESVDRNVLSLLIYHPKYGSLSARRAWIEISVPYL